LKRLLKFILPNGVVELVRNRRKLRNIGRGLSSTEFFSSDRVALEADLCGLSLFAPGHVEKLRNVVDVGANVGKWSGMLLDCIAPEKLIVIEPMPDAFGLLQKKFGGNRRVELHNVAIGERESIETLKITRDITGASLLQPREEMRAVIGSNWTIASEVQVKMTTLDRLLVNLGEASLLKIDVQGYEKSVLAGAHQNPNKNQIRSHRAELHAAVRRRLVARRDSSNSHRRVRFLSRQRNRASSFERPRLDD
jgi:FkbM family methyltransferase